MSETPRLTEDERVNRTLAIIRSLHDLKEEVLFNSESEQPAFDAGLLAAAIGILQSTIDPDDQRMKDEIGRQVGARLLRVLAPEPEVGVVPLEYVETVTDGLGNQWDMHRVQAPLDPSSTPAR